MRVPCLPSRSIPLGKGSESSPRLYFILMNKLNSSKTLSDGTTAKNKLTHTSEISVPNKLLLVFMANGEG